VDGLDEEVAVKILSLRNAPPELVEFARKELSLMCTVAQKLTGYVIELKGFHEDAGRELVLAMELAESSLRDLLRTMPNKQMELQTWVCVLLCCSVLASMFVALAWRFSGVSRQHSHQINLQSPANYVCNNVAAALESVPYTNAPSCCCCCC
jgi:hypothetical protein